MPWIKYLNCSKRDVSCIHAHKTYAYASMDIRNIFHDLIGDSFRDYLLKVVITFKTQDLKCL